METRIVRTPVAFGLVLLAVACGSGEKPSGSDAGGTGPTGGSSNTAGALGGGAGGAGATGGGVGGSLAGGTGGVSGSTPDAGASGAPVGGGGAGGSSLGGAGASGGADAGGSAGANGGAGASGGGAAAGGATGVATFMVQSQLASAVNASAPTTVGIVTWSVDVASISAATIDFGLTTAYGMRAPVDLTQASYRTLLLGMKPASTYHFRIVATAGATSYPSGDYTITTGAPTTAVSIGNFQVRNAAARKPGFILLSYWRGTGAAVPFIIDADGAIVWWRTGGPNGIARAVMSADGKNLWMTPASNTGGAIQRVSMDGLDAQTYSNRIGSHDITPVSGATMAFLEYGESDCDSIYEIDPSGTATEIFESQGVIQSMGCHANALRYSQAENVYTFSDVNQDILVLSRAGAVQWRLSERVTGGNDAWGGTQHGHQLLDASIIIYANVAVSSSKSAFIEYSLQGQELQRYTGGGFSANLGDVQRLPGGNTLITYSNDGLIQEIDAQRNVVLEIQRGGTTMTSFGYSLWRETLYGPPPDISQ